MIQDVGNIEFCELLETKNFAGNGMLLRMKIIPTIILSLQEWLVASFEQARFQCCANDAQI